MSEGLTPLGLRWLKGPLAGREVKLDRRRVVVGRSRASDLVLNEEDAPLSSARHAELEWKDGAWWLRDLGSTNGTFVNGARIERRALRAGDRLGFGGDALVVCDLAGSAGGAAAGTGGAATGFGRRAAFALGAALALVLATVVFVATRQGSRPPDFAAVADRTSSSLYLIALEVGAGREEVGTGFAIGEGGLLASNAHVANALIQAGALPPRAGGPRAVAVRNDSDGKARVIAACRLHPGYREGSFRDDVAILELSPGPALEPLALADPDALAALRRGVRVAVFGFPRASTVPARPRARLTEHLLGDVRGGRYLEIGFGVAPGVSGSPILDGAGSVVGVVVGGDFTKGPGPDEPALTASGVSWGVSAAAVGELLGGRAGPAEALVGSPGTELEFAL